MVKPEINETLLEEYNQEEIDLMDDDQKLDIYYIIREKQQEALLEIEFSRNHPDAYDPINGGYDD